MARTTLLLVIVILLAACSRRGGIVVGSKNFTEQVVLGEIIAQQIERRLGVPVERKLNLGGTLLAHGALKSGGIDLYPEYTGTALTAVLGKPASSDRASVMASVRDGYRPLKLTWLDPLGFNNSFAMVVLTRFAREHNLRTLSDAARRSDPWRLGVGYEFVSRSDGLTGLSAAYGLRVQQPPSTMDLGLLFPALQAGRIEMGAASATDGPLANEEFTVLEDDRRYFPPYECAIVVREEALMAHPQLRAVLAQLSGSISDATMRKLNAAVDRDHRNTSDVAREFLNERGR